MRWSFLLALVACTQTVTPDDHPTPQSPTPPPKPNDAPTVNGPKVYLSTPTGEVAVAVEVVATQGKIERGLMFRQHMAPDDGMLFLLGVDKEWTFWMHNTLIPLDMIFIRKSMTIAGIVENAEPKTETLRTVGEPSLYVLEVNGGYAHAHNIAKDAKVRFENLPAPPR